MPGPMEAILIAGGPILLVLPFWFIFSKAGFHGAMSLLILVPVLNIALLFFLAFAEWPALKNKK